MANETDIESQNVPIQADDCIICLSNDNENTPILNIRIICGDDRQYIIGNSLCNCSYNIHTKCFIETNRVFYNVCPCCRSNWWKDVDDPSGIHGIQRNNVTETETYSQYEFNCIISLCKSIVIGICIFALFIFTVVPFTE